MTVTGICLLSLIGVENSFRVNKDVSLDSM